MSSNQLRNWKDNSKFQRNYTTRGRMKDRIISILNERYPNGSTLWFKEIPRLAGQLEYLLYEKANSYDEYRDEVTIEERISQLENYISNNQNREEIQDDRRRVLKRQQHRLLLLRHASKCPHERDCPITPHCAQMKKLWNHVLRCSDDNCKEKCKPTRLLLVHYSKCCDVVCRLCTPVRETIRFNIKKSRQME